MARKFVVDDSEWEEVRCINGYAMFMGYMMMGVRGVGILIITWTTVVLLGGFVSDLRKKDFWCLTGITLVQSAGVFNFVLDETMSDLVHSGWGLLTTSAATVSKTFYKVLYKSELVRTFLRFLAFFLSGIQALVLVIVLCPVVVLFVFGIYISAGVGLWCLIQQDFGNADGAANLKSSLQILYSLAVAQGVLYGYKTIHAFGAKVGLAEFVANVVLSIDKDLVTAYLEETVKGCEKDPSFATERNLVTYAVDLMMDTKSNDGFVTSIKILGTALKDKNEPGRKVLAKHLMTRPSSSCSHLIQRLLDTLGSRSPYSGKIRAHASRIVALIASSIHLEEHPGWIHNILSVFETFEEYSWQPEEYRRDSNLPKEYERGWLLEEYEKEFLSQRTKSTVTTSEEGDNSNTIEDYIKLMQKGFNILEKLALHPENSRIIINTQGLLTKIMAPLNSKKLHRNQDALWYYIIRNQLSVMLRLVEIKGETGTKPQGDISLECFLECLECDVGCKISTIEVLLQLSVDTSSMKASGSSGRILTWILLLIFLSAVQEFPSLYRWNKIKINHDSSRLAGEKKLSSNQELPLKESVDYVLRDLTAALLSAGDISTRVHAAKILEFLVYEYRKDDEFLKDLKKGMVMSVMPEVLKEIIGGGSTGGAVTKSENRVQPSSSQEVDLETGGVSSGGGGRDQVSSSQQQAGDEIGIERLQKELTKLCWATKWSWYKADPDQARELDAIAEKISSEQGKPGKTFEELVEEEAKKYHLL